MHPSTVKQFHILCIIILKPHSSRDRDWKFAELISSMQLHYKKKKTYEPTLKVMKMKSHVGKTEDRFQKTPKTNNSFFLFIDFVDQILHQKARLCTKLHDQSFFNFCLTQTLTCHVQDCKTHSVTLSKINARTRWKIYHFAFMYLCFIMHFKFPHTANSRHSAYQ